MNPTRPNISFGTTFKYCEIPGCSDLIRSNKEFAKGIALAEQELANNGTDDSFRVTVRDEYIVNRSTRQGEIIREAEFVLDKPTGKKTLIFKKPINDRKRYEDKEQLSDILGKELYLKPFTAEDIKNYILSWYEKCIISFSNKH